MIGRQCFMPRKTLVRVTAITRFQLSSEISWSGAGSARPALLIMTSSRPNVSRARRSVRCMASSLAASILMAAARPPPVLISEATASARVPLRSATTTAAPSPAKRRAVAAPIPEPPAVTIATWPANRPGMPWPGSGRAHPLADDVPLVERVGPHLRLPAPDVRGVVPELRHRQVGVLELVGAEVARLAGGGRAVAHGVDRPGELEQERQVLVVVEVVEEGFAVGLDVHHHPEDVRSFPGEGGLAADPLVPGQVAVHGVRAHARRPPPRLAGGLPRRALEHVQPVELVGGEVAWLGRRGLTVAAGPAHPGHGLEVGDVLAVVDIVEGRLVIVRHVHPDQEQRVIAHVNPPSSALA